MANADVITEGTIQYSKQLGAEALSKILTTLRAAASQFNSIYESQTAKMEEINKKSIQLTNERREARAKVMSTNHLTKLNGKAAMAAYERHITNYNARAKQINEFTRGSDGYLRAAVQADNFQKRVFEFLNVKFETVIVFEDILKKSQSVSLRLVDDMQKVLKLDRTKTGQLTARIRAGKKVIRQLDTVQVPSTAALDQTILDIATRRERFNSITKRLMYQDGEWETVRFSNLGDANEIYARWVLSGKAASFPTGDYDARVEAFVTQDPGSVDNQAGADLADIILSNGQAGDEDTLIAVAVKSLNASFESLKEVNNLALEIMQLQNTQDLVGFYEAHRAKIQAAAIKVDQNNKQGATQIVRQELTS